LLYLANWIVHLFWNSGKDPDNFAIPYLTAIGDLLGTAFLAVAFHMLYLLGKIKPKLEYGYLLSFGSYLEWTSVDNMMRKQ